MGEGARVRAGAFSLPDQLADYLMNDRYDYERRQTATGAGRIYHQLSSMG